MMFSREKVIKELEEVIAEAVYPDRPRKFMMPLQLAEDVLAMLKAQEHPTDECIRNAIFCLQNPHDCLETEVEEARKMSLYALKAREPKMVTGVAETYKDILVGNCPSCDQTIVSNVKKPTKYCRFCGQGVAFE